MLKKNKTYLNALKKRAVNVYATVKQHLKISAWYAHILLYLVARVYACTGASAKAKIQQFPKGKNRTFTN